MRCAPAVAAEREAARGDRVAGMAAAQAESVHRGVTFHLVSSRASAADRARAVAARVTAARVTAARVTAARVTAGTGAAGYPRSSSAAR
ncbi:hypothetical protein ACIQI7_19150 [Kitasatospora sp. NPDC092039]|uniref:phosphotransferase-like protein n=1 Tax=Kitasatospora sp. NPDC092039 TaxID=3364086 RepID=UPI0037FB3D39